MKMLLGLSLVFVIALCSGCLPYEYSYGYYQRPAAPRVVRQCPSYAHYHWLDNGRRLVHRPRIALPRHAAPDGFYSRLADDAERNAPASQRVLAPDFGENAASQPATDEEERLNRLERRVEAIAKGTLSILGVVQRFRFDDQPLPPPKTTEAAAPDDK